MRRPAWRGLALWRVWRYCVLPRAAPAAKARRLPAARRGSATVRPDTACVESRRNKVAGPDSTYKHSAFSSAAAGRRRHLDLFFLKKIIGFIFGARCGSGASRFHVLAPRIRAPGADSDRLGPTRPAVRLRSGSKYKVRKMDKSSGVFHRHDLSVSGSRPPQTAGAMCPGGAGRWSRQ